MNVACSSCNSTYDLPENRLPKGRVVSFPCPACKNKITLDLREPEETVPDDDGSDRVIFKPLDDSSETGLSISDVKKKILNKIKDLPPMPKVLFKAHIFYFAP